MSTKISPEEFYDQLASNYDDTLQVPKLMPNT